MDISRRAPSHKPAQSDNSSATDLRPGATLSTLARKLPAFPVCAAEVIRAMRNGTIGAERLVQLASHDQILSGGLIEAANSAAYTWSGKVRTIEQAVLYLGEVRASQVLMNAALKPILAVAGHQKLWEHSLEVAYVAQRIAAATHAIHISDAYILGLLHDVGSLLFKIAPQDPARVETLIASGWERADAELSVYGVNHGQAGAEVLRFWKMPDDCVAAVEHHHHPEKGGGAGSALLYLAEQWTDPYGDGLSDARLELALSTLRLESMDNLIGMPHPVASVGCDITSDPRP